MDLGRLSQSNLQLSWQLLALSPAKNCSPFLLSLEPSATIATTSTTRSISTTIGTAWASSTKTTPLHGAIIWLLLSTVISKIIVIPTTIVTWNNRSFAVNLDNNTPPPRFKILEHMLRFLHIWPFESRLKGLGNTVLKGDLKGLGDIVLIINNSINHGATGPRGPVPWNHPKAN